MAAERCCTAAADITFNCSKLTWPAWAERHAARSSPSEKPTWLDAGPVRNWHSATAYPVSSIQHLRFTNSL
jgi:hypothetical protein